MNPYRLFLGSLLFISAFCSCKKDYTCHCAYKTNGSVAYFQDEKITGKEDYAVSRCDENDFSRSETVNNNGVDTTLLYTAECDVINR